MRDKRSIRVSLNIEELGHVVGSLRERIDGYDEQLAEGADEEHERWLNEALAVIRPLERRLTRRGALEDDRS